MQLVWLDRSNEFTQDVVHKEEYPIGYQILNVRYEGLRPDRIQISYEEMNEAVLEGPYEEDPKDLNLYLEKVVKPATKLHGQVFYYYGYED